MASLLERKLIVVTGKGGTGKTTVACALGLLGARRGLRTVVVELGDQHRLPVLFASHQADSEGPRRDFARPEPQPPEAGVEVELEAGLWSTSIDPDRALLEWLRTLAGRLSARMLAASSTFHYFAAAAPGAKELVTMVKLLRLCESAYDLVVLDAPATGHALAMLGSPQTFSTIVRVGPLADQAQGVRDLLGDRARCAYLAVAQGTEMAVTETLELEEGLRRQLDRDLDAVLVNGVLPRRFTREEMGRIDGVAPLASGATSASDSSADVRAEDVLAGDVAIDRAVRAARATYERTRLQQSQIARLRRQRFADGRPPAVLTIPFVFTPELDLGAIREIAVSLERKL
ncbi:MAG: ArsA-related P-loop ATPase [Solirubrobacteraceae bacterium]